MTDGGEGIGTASLSALALGPASRLLDEVERLRDEARHKTHLADRRAAFWAFADIILGFPAALLAGVSGAAGLATADARTPAALLALASAGLAAGAGFLRSDSRRVGHKRARRAWAALEGEASVTLTQEQVDQASLRRLFAMREAALVAYEGTDA
ncbi:hypothetical protein [Actinacidiphila acidipaludis]|uniref:SLATT domain-containing protein n=1 Tax=Actinacidiphila acidipaludis TaxID=2873382 RepID=A0ABS7Q748_9ACTN|nr:hypothetical protein [Streptomyces acidipaludis]MBY8878554.1 hypothetical protein [Streptomyces acidipaludis]